MQDLEKIQEIEELGLESPESYPQEEIPEGNTSGIPLVQAMICLLVLAALLLLRYTESPQYQRFVQWYQEEANEEILLPSWEELTPETSAQPSVSPAPSASPGPLEADASLQRV